MWPATRSTPAHKAESTLGGLRPSLPRTMASALCGIAPLVLPGELARAAYHLGQGSAADGPRRAASACQHVAVLTGYPCCPGSPPTETDGPLGAIATARALAALGKRATILTDSINEVSLTVSMRCHVSRCLGRPRLPRLPAARGTPLGAG